jgi:heat shock protein HslJ
LVKKSKRKISIFLGMTFLWLAACTTQPGSLPDTGSGQTSQAANSLEGTKWNLVSFGEQGAETPLIENSSITLEFDSGEQASGSAGCNSYSAQYKAQGNSVFFGEITRTLRACQQAGIDQQEQSYFQALETVSKFELPGDRLTIWYNEGQSDLNFSK